MKAVILCAGSSTRTYPLTVNKPKVLLKVMNKTLLEHSLEQIEGLVDEVVLVSEDEIKNAIRYLALENKLVCEGSSAKSLAAALKTPKDERGKTVCVLSGGSIDTDKLTKIIS